MRAPRIRFVAALLLALSVATAASLGAQAGPFSAQIQLAFQQLGLWPFGIYAGGDFPVYNATTKMFKPSSASGTVILLPPSTCAAPALAEAGSPTTGVAFTLTPSVVLCVGGTNHRFQTANYSILHDSAAIFFGASADLSLARNSTKTLGITDGSATAFLFNTANGAMRGTFDTALLSLGVNNDVVLAHEGSGATYHLFDRNGTNAMRESWAMRYGGAADYEAFAIDAGQTTANTFAIGARTAATGTARVSWYGSQGANAGNFFFGMSVQPTGAPRVGIGGYALDGITTISSAAAGIELVRLADFTFTATSGTTLPVTIRPTYNQSGSTAANSDLLIQRTETSVGSGAQYLIQAGTAASQTLFTVDNVGEARAISFAANNAPGPTGSITLNGGSGAAIALSEAANHWIQRNSTNAQRFSVANTYTSASNNELFSVDWQTVANTAFVGTRTAATGTNRRLRLESQLTNAGNQYSLIDLDGSGAPAIRLEPFSTSTLGTVSTTSTGNFVQIAAATTSTTTSGSVAMVAITPTYNQSSGTAANTDLLINRTQTAVGSGAQNFLDLQVGGVSKFNIDNAGNVLGSGTNGLALFSNTVGQGVVMNGDITTATGIGAVILQNQNSFTASSGVQRGLSSNFTLNQTSTAAFVGFLQNIVPTALGSGVQRFIEADNNSAARFYITLDGTTRGTQVAFIQGTAPTCTAANNCGTGNGTFATGSSDTAGSVTLGTTPASGFVITFNGTWAAAPTCVVWMNKAGMAAGKAPLTSVTTTTTITVVTNGTAPATGDIYAYHCIGIQ